MYARHVYRAYGLNIASTHCIPYLPCSNSDIVDVHIDFVKDRPEQRPWDGPFHFWRTRDGGLGLWTRLVGGYGEYTINHDGSLIRVAQSGGVPLLEVLRYVTGVSFGAVLRFKDVLCLHASALAVNGSALIFAGSSHAGKSSLSAAFHQRGYSLITEDVCALDRQSTGFSVRPGYAGIRLYPETLELLYGADAVTDAMQVDQKYLHRLDAIPAAPCPVQALYLLAPRNPQLTQPRITPLDPTSALLALTDHFYLHRFGPKEWLARDFPRLGELVQRLPAHALERPDSLSHLDATIDLILEQQASGERERMEQVAE